MSLARLVKTRSTNSPRDFSNWPSAQVQEWFVITTVESAHDIIRKFVIGYPVVLHIQREFVDERSNVAHITVGKAINKESNGQTVQYQTELKAAQEEEVLKEGDSETRRKKGGDSGDRWRGLRSTRRGQFRTMPWRRRR